MTKTIKIYNVYLRSSVNSNVWELALSNATEHAAQTMQNQYGKFARMIRTDNQPQPFIFNNIERAKQ